MNLDLFGYEHPTDAPPKKRMDAAPAGYAGTPGKGPEGETCKTCDHNRVRHFSKTYHKCELMRIHWTGGRRTDILVNSKACEKFEPKRRAS